jgi:hypothetical protein
MRRFPPPWHIIKRDACFVVHDVLGQPLGHFYYEDEQTRREAGHFLTGDEARRLALNFAKLPMLLKKA